MMVLVFFFIIIFFYVMYSERIFRFLYNLLNFYYKMYSIWRFIFEIKWETKWKILIPLYIKMIFLYIKILLSEVDTWVKFFGFVFVDNKSDFWQFFILAVYFICVRIFFLDVISYLRKGDYFKAALLVGWVFFLVLVHMYI